MTYSAVNDTGKLSYCQNAENLNSIGRRSCERIMEEKKQHPCCVPSDA